MLDKFDKRILRTYLNEYLGEFLFNPFDKFHLWDDGAQFNYRIPYEATDKADFLGKKY